MSGIAPELREAYADLGDDWLREQIARLRQKHLQFGKHSSLDITALVAQAAQAARSARMAGAQLEVTRLAELQFAEPANAPILGQKPALPGDWAEAQVTMLMAAPWPHTLIWDADLDELIAGLTFERQGVSTWAATTAQDLEIIVADASDAPSRQHAQKATAALGDRGYLEGQARRLLVPFTEGIGTWRLTRLDFGPNARVQDFEFLMCFDFQTSSPDSSAASSFAEVGFAVSQQAGQEPIFVLAVNRTAKFHG